MRTDPTTAANGTISFSALLISSAAFKTLFKDGMSLVETTASYLDGPGRQEAKALPRPAGLAYASESMRLTTRLMQLASWLLLQRAVNEGEMTQAQAALEKNKVRLTPQEPTASMEVFQQLPQRLRDLTEQSLRLQERVTHFDQMVAQAGLVPVVAAPSPVQSQFDRLSLAFARGQ